MFKIFSKQKVKLQEIKKEEIQLKEQTDALSKVDEKYSLLYEKANKMFTKKNKGIYAELKKNLSNEQIITLMKLYKYSLEYVKSALPTKINIKSEIL